jgi:hypothetical protein
VGKYAIGLIVPKARVGWLDLGIKVWPQSGNRLGDIPENPVEHGMGWKGTCMLREESCGRAGGKSISRLAEVGGSARDTGWLMVLERQCCR